jgi:hypothetical protein
MDTAQLKVSCTTNRVCGWSAIGFGGLGTTALPVASGQCNNLPISVRSAWNAAYVSQRFWQYSNCTGSNVVLLPGTTNGDMIVGHRGCQSSQPVLGGVAEDGIPCANVTRND